MNILDKCMLLTEQLKELIVLTDKYAQNKDTKSMQNYQLQASLVYGVAIGIGYKDIFESELKIGPTKAAFACIKKILNEMHEHPEHIDFDKFSVLSDSILEIDKLTYSLEDCGNNNQINSTDMNCDGSEIHET